MNTLGIISEYNPFHNGHSLHILSAKEQSGCDFAVAVMSGNFVQRGEPALIDKYLRAQAALASGADMVLELPVYFASASAEYFAQAAVKLLNATGIANKLAFGSESGDIDGLLSAARSLAFEDESFKASLKAGLKAGKSYPRARACAADVPVSPNDILAAEYLKAIYKTGSELKPVVIRRRGAEYHQSEITGGIASATAIRRAFLSGRPERAATAMPPRAYEILANAFAEGNYVRGLDAYSREFRHILRAGSRLDEIMDISEGLHNRFIEMSGKFSAPTDIISAVKTKRYTRTRLNRAALHILLGIRRQELEKFSARGLPPYIRVLGMKKTAGALMKTLTANAACPVITYLRRAVLDADGRAMLEKEIITTDIYYSGLYNARPVPARAEYRQPFVIE